ncbi:MAG: hypothetical protein GY847_17825, partial [Proteobacteria bacterium]|nr:hypothetical protein [Pseudomonadota bacterium]
EKPRVSALSRGPLERHGRGVMPPLGGIILRNERALIPTSPLFPTLTADSVAAGTGAMLRVGSIALTAGYLMRRLESVLSRLCRFRRLLAVGAMPPLGGIAIRKRHRSVRPRAFVLGALTGIGARISPKYAARGI